MKNAAKLFPASLALGAILACGGGNGPNTPQNSAATKLTYTNPTQGDYRLEVTGGSGTGTITLALRGPSSERARGVNFGLGADTAKAKFVEQEGNDYAGQGTVFELGQAPKIFRAVLDGENMRVSMAQKGNSVAAKPMNGDIATVSLQLQSEIQKGPVRLTALAGAKVLLENGNEKPVEVNVGTLTAQ